MFSLFSTPCGRLGPRLAGLAGGLQRQVTGGVLCLLCGAQVSSAGGPRSPCSASSVWARCTSPHCAPSTLPRSPVTSLAAGSPSFSWAEAQVGSGLRRPQRFGRLLLFSYMFLKPCFIFYSSSMFCFGLILSFFISLLNHQSVSMFTDFSHFCILLLDFFPIVSRSFRTILGNDKNKTRSSVQKDFYCLATHHIPLVPGVTSAPPAAKRVAADGTAHLQF